MRKKSRTARQARVQLRKIDPRLPELIRARGEVWRLGAITGAIIVVSMFAVHAGAFASAIIALLTALRYLSRAQKTPRL